MRSGEWVPLPPEDVPTIPIAKPALAGTGVDGEAVHPPPLQTDIGAQDGIPPVVASRDRRDSSTGKIFDIEPEAKPSRDFRITGAHRIGQWLRRGRYSLFLPSPGW